MGRRRIRWEGCGEVYLPEALTRKFPNAGQDWRWQYVFPSGRLSTDPRGGAVRRHHVHENALRKAVNQAARKAGIMFRGWGHYPLVRPGLAMVA